MCGTTPHQPSDSARNTQQTYRQRWVNADVLQKVTALWTYILKNRARREVGVGMGVGVIRAVRVTTHTDGGTKR